jgi:hypothetical protein
MGEVTVPKLLVTDRFALRGLETHDQPGVARPLAARLGEVASWRP